MTALADPRLWRAVSSVLLVLAIVGFVLGAGFSWVALILSGVTFAVELALVVARRRR